MAAISVLTYTCFPALKQLKRPAVNKVHSKHLLKRCLHTWSGIYHLYNLAICNVYFRLRFSEAEPECLYSTDLSRTGTQQADLDLTRI